MTLHCVCVYIYIYPHAVSVPLHYKLLMTLCIMCVSLCCVYALHRVCAVYMPLNYVLPLHCVYAPVLCICPCTVCSSTVDGNLPLVNYQNSIVILSYVLM